MAARIELGNARISFESDSKAIEMCSRFANGEGRDVEGYAQNVIQSTIHMRLVARRAPGSAFPMLLTYCGKSGRNKVQRGKRYFLQSGGGVWGERDAGNSFPINSLLCVGRDGACFHQ